MTEAATELIRRMQNGDGRAADRLLRLVYGTLHEIALGAMRGERSGHTLQATALVHEAWIRLTANERAPEWESRAQFLRTAARAMRNVLVDHARRRGARKRGTRVELEPEAVLERVAGVFEDRRIDVVAVHEALERLERFDPDLGRMVELRFFAGLSVPEAARVLGVSVSTVERQWRTVRAWLRAEIPRGDDD